MDEQICTAGSSTLAPGECARCGQHPWLRSPRRANPTYRHGMSCAYCCDARAASVASPKRVPPRSPGSRWRLRGCAAYGWSCAPRSSGATRSSCSPSIGHIIWLGSLTCSPTAITRSAIPCSCASWGRPWVATTCSPGRPSTSLLMRSHWSLWYWSESAWA